MVGASTKKHNKLRMIIIIIFSFTKKKKNSNKSCFRIQRQFHNRFFPQLYISHSNSNDNQTYHEQTNEHKEIPHFSPYEQHHFNYVSLNKKKMSKLFLRYEVKFLVDNHFSLCQQKQFSLSILLFFSFFVN